MVLDYVALPILIVARGGRVIVCNRAARALLGSRHDVTITRSRLSVADRDDDLCLRAAIERALRSGSEESCEVVRIGKQSDETPLALCVAAIPSAGTPLAVLFVIDFNPATPLAPELLSAVYGLSAAQARVAAELVRGRDPSQIAASLFITVHTVRAHIKNILAKMGLHRQSDIIRVLAAGPAALLLSPGALENNSK